MALKSSVFCRGQGNKLKLTATCGVLNYEASREKSERGAWEGT